MKAPWTRLLVMVGMVLGGAALCVGQVPELTNLTSTPVPGGHTYIGLLSETVNPLNGAVSARISTSTAPGRRMGMPFSFAYDSNGIFTTDPHGWYGPLRGYLTVGGWSYSLPYISVSPRGILDDASGAVCNFFTNYVFYDPSGGRNLMLDEWPAGGKDRHCKFGRSFAHGSSAGVLLTNGFEPQAVATLDGTVYHFPGIVFLDPFAETTHASRELNIPDFIEDTNGNQIHITNLSSQQGQGGAFSVSDELGRTLISSTGLGSTGNTVSVAGLANPYTFTWTTTTVDFTTNWTIVDNFDPIGCPTPNTGVSSSLNVLQNLGLPNGTQYTFDYDPTYGTLRQVTYPTGAWVKYEWGLSAQSEAMDAANRDGSAADCGWVHDRPSVTKRTVSVDGRNIVLEQDFSYSVSRSGAFVNALETTVTTHDLVTNKIFKTTYDYTRPDNGDDTWVEATITYKDENDHVLKTITKAWWNQYHLKSESVTLENGLTSQVTYDYNPISLDDPDPKDGTLAEKDEYDFGATTPTRKTLITYQAFPASPIFPIPTGSQVKTQILDRACKVVVQDGSSNTLSESDFLYDNGTVVCGAVGTPSVSPVNNLPTGTHDEANFGSGANASRGNVTSAVKKCSPNCADVGKTYTYDSTGQVTSVTDGNSNTTTYSYVDNYSDIPKSTTVNTNAYLTKMTQPKANGVDHITTYLYAFSNGQLTSSTDENGNTTQYFYKDPLLRLTETDFADGGQVSTAYDDANLTVTTTTEINSSLSEVSTVVRDGMGHTIQTQLNSDPSGTVYTDTVYDGIGRPISVSNPHRSTSEPTAGIVSFAYDALGRTTDVIKPDGSIVHTDYSGNITTVTDEAGASRQVRIDALNRVVEVDEPQASKGLGTPGTAASASGSVNGAVQLDPAVLSAILQTITGFLLSDSVTSTSTSASSATAQSASDGQLQQPTQISPSASMPPQPLPASAAKPLNAASATPNPAYDSGKVWITVPGFTATAFYQQGSTAASVVRDLAAQFNDLKSASPVSARVDGSGSHLTLFARVPGQAGNFSIVDQGTLSDRPDKFPNPSFTISMSAVNAASAVQADLSGPMVTLYQYNPLGNMLRVDQKGTSSDSTQWRTRTFTYDTLSHLLTSSNPESGTICYGTLSGGNCTSGYDANGNMTSKTTPRGIVTTYSYDQLNRLTQRTYSDGTPTVIYQYDTSCCGVTSLNPIGRMTAASSGNTELVFSYDSMGRPITQWDCPPSGVARGSCYVISALYDRAGNLTSLTYPDGRVMNFTYDAANQPLTATDSNGPQYVSNATYGPSGHAFERFMPNIYSRTDLNNRLQIASVFANGVGYYLNKSYIYNNGQNNGNVVSITNNRDTTRNQSFAYDALNRLISAQNGGTDCSKTTVDGKTTLYWGVNFGYDAWGNLLSKTASKCSPEPLSVTAQPNNQLLGYSYDPDGNLTTDPDPTHGFTATYDAAERIQTVTKNKVAASYTYNAADNRVRKDVGSSSTEYFYFGGGVIAERDQAGNWKDYVFFDGERVARIDQPGNIAHYYLSDALNSTSVVVGAAGALENESDYYPFGSELQIVTNDPGNHHKFTGKELDAESGLYNFGARYYGPVIGRFITPDPLLASGHPLNPQTWNRYTYALNNPVRYVDPDGLDPATEENLLHEPFCQGPTGSFSTKQGCVEWKDYADLKNLMAKKLELIKFMIAIELMRQDCKSRACRFGAKVSEWNKKIETYLKPWEQALANVLSLADTRPNCPPGMDCRIGIVFMPGRGGLGAAAAVEAGAAAEAELGVIYLRTDLVTGEEYVGQAETIARYKARQLEEAAEFPNADFHFDVLDRAKAGKDLNVAEESWIRAGGGPKKYGGRLANKRWQMNEKAYREAGGKVDRDF
jgi:RHS repeat-associated protein